MEENKFEILVSVLGILEHEDIKDSGLDRAIIRIMGEFSLHLSSDQKGRLTEEFFYYEKLRLEKEFNEMDEVI